MGNGKAKHQKRPLFDPDRIATLIDQAVRADLEPVVRENCRFHTPLGMLAYRQTTELTKKYVNPASKSDLLRQRAFDKFLNVRDHMSTVEISYPDRFTSCQRKQMSETESILYRARYLFRMVLGDFSETEWFSKCRHSSGSTVGVPFVDTSIEAKSTFPISLTERVKPLMSRYLNFDSEMKLAIDEFNGYRPLDEWWSVVRGSSAMTVRKTSEIDRFIAKEPTANMFFQQGLMEMMYDRLEAFGLDVSHLPDIHQMLAWISSITGAKATVDWRSASDCVLYGLVRWLSSPDWFWALDITRSPEMEVNGSWVSLPMFSTMGNAVTFPLETLVFWALAEASCMHQQGGNTVWLEKSDFQCSVFGDDCIVPVEVAPLFTRVCSSVGFLLNEEKSFMDPNGKFRESCGGDFLSGYDVRPFSLKGPTSDKWSAGEPWLYIVLNRITQKYTQCFGPTSYLYDKAIYKLVFSLFDELGYTMKFVPPFYPDDAGFKTPDIARFMANYSFDCSTVGIDPHGSVDFASCRFRYRQKPTRDREEQFGRLHYATWLKRPSRSRVSLKSEKRRATVTKFLDLRKSGGYVIARAQTGHWSAFTEWNSVARPKHKVVG